MADPLSITASIVAVLQLTSTVIQYISDAQDASQERLRLRDEISSSSWALYMLKDRAEQAREGQPWQSSMALLGVPGGPLDQFKGTLEQLAAKLLPAKKKMKGLGELGRAIAWPFQKEEVLRFINALERQKSLFHLALQNDSFTLAQAIKEDTNKISAIAEDVTEIKGRIEEIHFGEGVSQRRKIIDWISPLNFFPLQDDIFGRREEGTGLWLLESPQFLNWIHGIGETLWCPGIPGAGKTMLTSIVVDHLRTLCSTEVKSGVGMAFLFFNYKEHAVQTPVNMLASVWMQLVQGTSSISKSVKDLYEKHVDRNTRPTLKEVSKILKEEMEKYKKVFIVIDALDESPDEWSRTTLLQELQALQPTVNLMATSRFLDTIAREFEGLPMLEISASSEDVRAYIIGRLSKGGQLARHVRADATLAEDIEKTVLGNSQKMFLLAQLSMDSLVSKGSRKAVRESLKTLPKDLDSTYEEALRRIEDQSEDERLLAHQVLLWISSAVRPLELDELQEALAVEVDTHNLDKDNLPEGELLTSVCAGLVIVDKSSSIIRLVHYSAQEYFRRVASTRFATAHIDIVKACLTYLLFGDFAAGPTIDEDKAVRRINEHHLLSYAAQNWGKHARGDPELIASDAILTFLDDSNKLSNSVQVAHFVEYWYKGESQRYAKNTTGLHVAAHFGLAYIMDILLSKGANVAAKDSLGQTALHKAAQNGHEKAVRLLLEQGANIETEDNEGWTALHKAVAGGNAAVVLLLLENGAKVSKGIDGRTALHFAAEFGNEAIASALLGNGADVMAQSVPSGSEINRKFLGGRTPLHWAAAQGYDGLAKLLLEHGADANAKSFTARTALQEAIMWSRTPVVEILLEHGAVVTESDDEGWTPLHEAAYRAPLKIAEMILDHGANMEAKTRFPQGSIPDPWGEVPEAMRGGSTPLHIAATSGNEEVLKLLVSRGANHHSADAGGLTAIHMAVLKPEIPIVQILLDSGDAIDVKDLLHGETPLHKAARLGNADCVLFLLEKGADIKLKNNEGHDAIAIAQAAGQTECAQALLEYENQK